MKKVLVAIDGSDHGWKAVDIVRTLGECKALEIAVLHVVEDHSLYRNYGFDTTHEGYLNEAAKKRAQDVVAQAKERFSDYAPGNVDFLVKTGEPAKVIVNTAESEGFDTIVIGSRGMGTMTRLLVGSVSQKVVAHAPCSVFVVR